MLSDEIDQLDGEEQLDLDDVGIQLDDSIHQCPQIKFHVCADADFFQNADFKEAVVKDSVNESVLYKWGYR